MPAPPSFYPYLEDEYQPIHYTPEMAFGKNRIRPKTLRQKIAETEPAIIVNQAVQGARYGTSRAVLGFTGYLEEAASNLGLRRPPGPFIETAGEVLEAERGKAAPHSPEAQRAIEEGYWNWQRAVEQGAATIGEAAPGVGLGVLNIPSGMAYFGMQSAGNEYLDASKRLRERGYSEEESHEGALWSATASGAVTYLTSKLPLEQITKISPTAGKTVWQIAASRAAKIPLAAGAEATQENLEQLSGELWQRAVEQDPDAFKDWWKQHLDVSILAGISGGAAAGAHIAAEPVIGAAQAKSEAKLQSRLSDIGNRTAEIASSPEGMGKLRALAAKEAPSRKDFQDAGYDWQKHWMNEEQRSAMAEQLRLNFGELETGLPPEVQLGPRNRRELEEGILREATEYAQQILSEAPLAPVPVEAIQQPGPVPQEVPIPIPEQVAEIAAAPEPAPPSQTPLPRLVVNEPSTQTAAAADPLDPSDAKRYLGEERPAYWVGLVEIPKARIATTGRPTGLSGLVSQAQEAGAAVFLEVSAHAETDVARKRLAKYAKNNGFVPVNEKKYGTDLLVYYPQEKIAVPQKGPVIDVAAEAAYQEALARDEAAIERVRKEFEAKEVARQKKRLGKKIAEPIAEQLVPASEQTVSQPLPELAHPESLERTPLPEAVVNEAGFFAPGKVAETIHNLLQGATEQSERQTTVGYLLGQAGKKIARGFRSRGAMPQEMFELKTREKALGRQFLERLQFTHADLKRAAKEVYGRKAIENGQLNEAVSQLVNQAVRGEKRFDELPQPLQIPAAKLRTMIDEQSINIAKMLREQMGAGPEAVKEDERQKLHKEWADKDYQDEVIATFRKAGKPVSKSDGQQIRQLKAPEGYDPTLTDARIQALDALDRKWALIETIEENIGTYETNAYRAFGDPLWKTKVSDDVLSEARKEIANRYAEDHPKEAPLTDNQINQRVGAILEAAAKAGEPIAFFEALTGRQDRSILKKRTLQSKAIQNLLGIRRDTSAIIETIVKQTNLYQNYQLLSKFRQQGMGKWFWTQDDPNIPDATHRIEAKGNKAMAPLDGLYATEDIMDALKEYRDTIDNPGLFLSAYFALERQARLNATTRSPKTQVRNIKSNPLIVTGNGHNLLSPTGINDFKQAWRIALTGMEKGDLKHALSGGEVIDPELRKTWLKLVGEGVVGENVELELIKELPKARGKLKEVAAAAAQQLSLGKPLHALAMLDEAAAGSYALGDNIFKVFNWLQERRKYQKGHPEWTDEQLDAMATKRTRALMPYYDLIPAAAKGLRKSPIGLFTAFRAERVRNLGGLFQAVQEDLADPQMRGMAVQRMLLKGVAAGATSTLSAAHLTWKAYLVGEVGRAAGLGLAAMLGNEDDKEKALRRLTAMWDKYGRLGILPDSPDGNPRYKNYSYMDPDGWAQETWRAFMEGDSLPTAIWKGAMQFLDPWIGEGLMAGQILDIARNQKSGGGKVYNGQSGGEQIAKDISLHLLEPLVPGVAKQAMDIYRGITKYESPTGKKYTAMQELNSIMNGSRVVTLDPTQSLKFRTKEYSEKMRNAVYGYTKKSNIQGTSKTSPEELAKAYEITERSRQHLFKELKLDAEAAGYWKKRDVVIQAMVDGGAGKDSAERVLAGKYEQYIPDNITEIDSILPLVDQGLRPELEIGRRRHIARLAEIAGYRGESLELTAKAPAAAKELREAKVTVNDIAQALREKWIQEDQRAAERAAEKTNKRRGPGEQVSPKTVTMPRLVRSRGAAMRYWGLRPEHLMAK